MTQGTIEQQVQRIGSSERLASLPALDKLRLSAGHYLCFLHGTKLLELSMREAREISRKLSALAHGASSTTRVMADFGDVRIEFFRSDLDARAFYMEWEERHGPFDKETFLAWTERLAISLRTPSGELAVRRVNPWARVGEGSVPRSRRGPRTATIIGD